MKAPQSPAVLAKQIQPAPEGTDAHITVLPKNVFTINAVAPEEGAELLGETVHYILDNGTKTTIGFGYNADGVCVSIFPFSPSVSAVVKGQMIFGNDALRYEGRKTGEEKETKIEPLYLAGMIKSQEAIRQHLKLVIGKLSNKPIPAAGWEKFGNCVLPWRWFRKGPRRSLTISIPSGEQTEPHRLMFAMLAFEAGFDEIRFVDQSKAAAEGAGFDILEEEGTLVVDIGGGNTCIRVICRGEIVDGGQTLVGLGGNKIDDNITFRLEASGVRVTPTAAEQIKWLVCNGQEVEGGPRIVKGDKEDKKTGEKVGLEMVEFMGCNGIEPQIELIRRPLELFQKEIAKSEQEIADAVHRTVARLLSDQNFGFLEDVTLKLRIAFTGGGANLHNVQKLVYQMLSLKGDLRLFENPEWAVPAGMDSMFRRGILDQVCDGPYVSISQPRRTFWGKIVGTAQLVHKYSNN